MRGETREERFGSLFAEKMREHICGGKRGEAEAREQEWVPREQMHRL